MDRGNTNQMHALLSTSQNLHTNVHHQNYVMSSGSSNGNSSSTNRHYSLYSNANVMQPVNLGVQQPVNLGTTSMRHANMSMSQSHQQYHLQQNEDRKQQQDQQAVDLHHRTSAAVKHHQQPSLSNAMQRAQLQPVQHADGRVGSSHTNIVGSHSMTTHQLGARSNKGVHMGGGHMNVGGGMRANALNMSGGTVSTIGGGPHSSGTQSGHHATKTFGETDNARMSLGNGTTASTMSGNGGDPNRNGQQTSVVVVVSGTGHQMSDHVQKGRPNVESTCHHSSYGKSGVADGETTDKNAHLVDTNGGSSTMDRSCTEPNSSVSHTIQVHRSAETSGIRSSNSGNGKQLESTKRDFTNCSESNGQLELNERSKLSGEEFVEVLNANPSGFDDRRQKNERNLVQLENVQTGETFKCYVNKNQCTMISSDGGEKSSGEDFTEDMSKNNEIADDLEEENDENVSTRLTKNGKPLHSCSMCPKKFARHSSLVKHYVLHNTEGSEQQTYVCTFCPKSFTDKLQLTRHVKYHSSNQSSFKCDQCNLIFNVKREYNKHMKIHDNVKLYLCSVCSKTFTDKVKFNRHMRAHEGIKPFQCNVCSESFTQRSNLNIHLRIHDGIRPFQCNVCYICFTNKSDLNRHSRIHDGIKPFLCSMCAKCFSRKDDLNRHMKIHEGIKRFLCPLCAKCFTRKDDLNRHLRNHEGLKPFQCTICFESFTQKSLLNIHLRIHTNNKPFLCTVCTESFSQKSNLYIHLKLQHNLNPFKCSVCTNNETFEKETQLNFHMRTVHGEKPFQCDNCNERFAKKSLLKDHLRVSHNINPFQCDVCYKFFTKKSNLKTHIKTHEFFNCEQCTESFETKDEYDEHVRKIHETGEFLDEDDDDDEFVNEKEGKDKCLNCTKCLKIVRVSKDVKVEQPFLCEACTDESIGVDQTGLKEKGSRNRTSIKETNCKKGIYKCEYCKKIFKYKNALIKHIRNLHDVDLKNGDGSNVIVVVGQDELIDDIKVEKTVDLDDELSVKVELGDDDGKDLRDPIRCVLCDKSFVRPSGLDRHLSVHGVSSAKYEELANLSADDFGVNKDAEDGGVQKLFECVLCDKRFVRRSMLDRHLGGQHKVSAVKYDELVKSDKEKLDEIKIETELDESGRGKVGRKSSYKCVLCDRVFVRKSSLDRHVSIHGISATDHDEIMGENEASASRGGALSRSKNDVAMPPININISETEDASIYIVLPKEELKEEVVSDYDQYEEDTVAYESDLDSHHVSSEKIVEETERVDQIDESNEIENEINETEQNSSDSGIGKKRKSVKKRRGKLKKGDKSLKRKKRTDKVKKIVDEFNDGCENGLEEEEDGYFESSEDKSDKMDVEKNVDDKSGHRRRKSEAESCTNDDDTDEKEDDEYFERTEDRANKSGDENGSRSTKAGKRRSKKDKTKVTEFPCVECGKVFGRKTTLKRHVRIHTGVKEFQCWVCMKYFMEKSHLTRHLRKHNEASEQIDSISPYTCSICDRKFTIKGQLSRHLRAHENEKPDSPSTCEICSKTFDKKAKYKRHMKVHDGIREHQCQVCGNRFKQKSNLNIHMKIHDGIREHQCNVCMISFTNKSDLNRHMRKHDGIRPFLCSICAKSFSRKDDLNRHMRKHDGIKPFVCTTCNEAFSRKDHLKKHMRKCFGPNILSNGQVKPRKRLRKPNEGTAMTNHSTAAAAMVAAVAAANQMTSQDLSLVNYRNSTTAPANMTHAQVLQASAVGQAAAAASGLFWAQYYTAPPHPTSHSAHQTPSTHGASATLDFVKSDYYA